MTGGWHEYYAKELHIAREENKQLRKELERFKDALIWCSGSGDFQLEGTAREGWERLCAPLLEE